MTSPRYAGPLQHSDGGKTNLHKLAHQDLGYAALIPGDILVHEDDVNTKQKTLRIIYRMKKVRGHTGHLRLCVRPKESTQQNEKDQTIFEFEDGVNGQRFDIAAGGPRKLEAQMGTTNPAQASWTKWRVWRVISGTWYDIGCMDALRQQWNAVLPSEASDVGPRSYEPPAPGTVAWMILAQAQHWAPKDDGPSAFTSLQQWLADADPDEDGDENTESTKLESASRVAKLPFQPGDPQSLTVGDYFGVHRWYVPAQQEQEATASVQQANIGQMAAQTPALPAQSMPSQMQTLLSAGGQRQPLPMHSMDDQANTPVLDNANNPPPILPSFTTNASLDYVQQQMAPQLQQQFDPNHYGFGTPFGQQVPSQFQQGGALQYNTANIGTGQGVYQEDDQDQLDEEERQRLAAEQSQYPELP